jgi:hypothetical protein
MPQDEPGSIFGLLRRGLKAKQEAKKSQQAAQQAAQLSVATDAPRRDQQLAYAREAPLAYGHWAELKRLYKQAEQAQDLDLLAILIARLDTATAPANPYAPVIDALRPLGIVALQAMQIDGACAYLVTTDRSRQIELHVIDISTPALPRSLGTLRLVLGEDVVGLAVRERQAVILTRGRHGQECKIYFIDVSQPARPTLVKAHKAALLGGIAFVGRHLAALFTERQASRLSINAADAQNPVAIGTVPVANPQTLRIDGNVAYVHARPSQIIAYDISDPAHPHKTLFVNVPAPSDYAVQGARLTVTVENRHGGQHGPGLYLYDLNYPERPSGFLAISDAKAVALQGDFAYVGTSQSTFAGDRFHESGLKIVDIKDMSNPRLVGAIDGVGVSRLAARGPYVFATMKHSFDEAATLRIIDVSDPARPILLGRSPDAATLGYMKRRARRLLRTLAIQAPDSYVDLATRVLTLAGQGKSELDTPQQWISMDLLYGGGACWQQAAHGRGSYRFSHKGLRLRRREERHPALWNHCPAHAAALAAEQDLPWQTQEAAVKMLHSMKVALPPLTDALAARYLRSPAPLLVAVAVRALTAKVVGGQHVAADLAADLHFLGNGRAHSAVESLLAQQPADKTWNHAFADRLYALASLSTGNTLSRRQSRAFACLATRFQAQLDAQVTPQLAALFYATGKPELAAWAVAVMQRSAANDIVAWLQALEPLPTDLRASALEQLIQAVRHHSFGASLLPALAFHASAWIRAAGWELIAASASAPANIGRLWNQLLESTEETDALRTAMHSPAALELLNRISFSREKIEALLPTRPFLIGLLPPHALRSMLEVLPIAAVPPLIAAAADTQWPALRAALVYLLREPERLMAFWQEVWPRIGEGNAPLLVARLLDDAALADTFLRLDDSLPFMETANPVYGPLLGRWLRVNGDRYGRDTPELLRVATHMLPDIRAYGLERVRAVGMSLPFALRLLESELPPSVATGREFIERLPSGEAAEMDAILALCDSPKPSVRAYGRDTLNARWHGLPLESVLNRLTENPDPPMQSYLAGKLLTGAHRPAQTPTFDQQVLRGRDRARRAKELVKKRLDQEPSHDIPLLLELARGGTPRDAEWALGQLARLALQGIDIEGFQIESPKQLPLPSQGRGLGG